MIGPTGVGKTEIARRLAKLSRAPFIKVEASKFTEVGYVGRDVESMIRDLVEIGIDMVRQEEMVEVRSRARENAEERLARMLLASQAEPMDEPEPPPMASNPLQQALGPFGIGGPRPQLPPEPDPADVQAVRDQLRSGALDGEEVGLDVADSGGNPFMTIFGQQGMEEMNLKDMLGQMPGFKGKTKRRMMKVPEALVVLEEQEAAKLIDQDGIQREALERVQQAGIVFLDEIDKVARRQGGGGGGPDVSREGVQRDLLPIVEGSTVSTKYGPVKTDHILFIAAGAFHVSKVSDLIPELQGRFPIRVELESLAEEDLVRILSEPKNALTTQYVALMATEGIELVFEQSAVASIARYAADANDRSENIGARRLHTVMEALLEELSFSAPERDDAKVIIDDAYVTKTLEPIVKDEDLARYVL